MVRCVVFVYVYVNVFVFVFVLSCFFSTFLLKNKNTASRLPLLFSFFSFSLSSHFVCSPQEETPLFVAAKVGGTTAVKFLLRCGANRTSKGWETETALPIFAHCGGRAVLINGKGGGGTPELIISDDPNDAGVLSNHRIPIIRKQPLDDEEMNGDDDVRVIRQKLNAEDGETRKKFQLVSEKQSPAAGITVCVFPQFEVHEDSPSMDFEIEVKKLQGDFRIASEYICSSTSFTLSSVFLLFFLFFFLQTG